MSIAAAALAVLLASAQDPAGDALATFRERARAHYRRAEAELRAAPTGELAPELAARRSALLDALHDYWTRGDFGRSEERVPVFVDDGGRRCAVAELLHASGEDELVSRVEASANGAFVYELAGDDAFAAWLERSGFTWREAARIQAPTAAVSAAPSNRPGRGFARGGTGGVPGSGAAAAAWSRSRGVAAAAAAAATTGSSGRALASAGAPVTIGGLSIPDFESHWWVWWEFNKLHWLLPASRSEWKDEQPEASRSEERLSSLRARWAPVVRRHLTHADGTVRAAAAVAYARIAGEAAVDPLVEALDDPQLGVRQDALLALGATGSGRAVHHLLRLVHEGRLDDVERVAPDAREIATLGLALARSRGGAAGTDAMLPSAESLEEASAVASLVHSSERLVRRAREASGLFEGTRRRASLRDARAEILPALREARDEDVLPALLRAVGARHVQVRRSAAATLGALGDPRAVEPLTTAFELEEEPMTRGLLLLSLGRLGGETARDFLVHVLEEGPKTSRPWCALALGICADGLARGARPAGGDGTAGPHPADVARRALREGFAREANHDAAGAYLLALGLARDLDAVPLLRHELVAASDPLTRSLAGLGLALTGAPATREALRGAIERESAPLARAALGQALALGRRPEDSVQLVQLLREVRLPGNQAQVAAAFAFQGSSRSVDLLGEALEDEALPTLPRAAALQALGLLLDDAEPFRVARLGTDSNYDILPWWVDGPMQSTL